MLNTDLNTQIKDALKKEPQIIAAYIIGSVASGKITSESDFDLVVVVKNVRKLSIHKLYELIKFINFPRNLDLSVVDHTSSPLFLYQIISKGKKVYESDKSVINRFDAHVMHNYYDTAYIRNIYNQALKAKFPYDSR